MVEDLDEVIERIKELAQNLDKLPAVAEADTALMYLRTLRRYVEEQEEGKA